jgi:hypothetical protein
MRHPFESRLTRGAAPLSTTVVARADKGGLTPTWHVAARRLLAMATPPDNEPTGALLGDILDANLHQRAELEAVRDWVRRASRAAKHRDAASADGRDPSFGQALTSANRSSRKEVPKHTRKLSRGAIHLED